MATPDEKMDAHSPAAGAPGVPSSLPSAASDRLEPLLAHAGYLRALARRLARDDAEADDLVQDTWTAAAAEPASVVRDPRAWLAGVLRNLARQKRRGEGRREIRERAGARVDGSESTESVVARVEIFRELAHEVVTLDEPYRSTLIQIYFQGLDAETIARRAGEPAATVRSRHKRALDKLRERLDERRGGRDAWKSALLPWLGAPWKESAPRTKPVSWLRWCAGGALLLGLGAGVRELVLDEPAPPPIAASVEEPRPSERATPPPAEPAPVERDALVTKRPRAPLALLLVDARTHRPVDDFAFVATDAEGESESLASDAQGRARGSKPFAAGSITLTLVDHPQLARWRDRARARRWLPPTIAYDHVVGLPERDATREIELALGPRIALELAGARVPADASIELALRSTQPAARVAVSLAPLRAASDGSAWVRFAAEADSVDGPGPWILTALVRPAAGGDALLAGHARLEVRDPARARIELAPCGSLQLVEQDGIARDRARLELVDLLAVADRDAPASSAARGDSDTSSSASRVEPLRSPRDPSLWEGVPPGSWQVRERGSDVFLAPEAALVELGRRTELAIAPSPALGPRIRGRVVFPDGLEARRVDVTARARDGKLHTRSFARRGDERAVAFELDGLDPAIDYEVAARCAGVYRWREEIRRARPSEDELVFEPVVAEHHANVVLWAVDAQSGASVTHFRARFAAGTPRRPSDSAPWYDAEVGHSGFSLVPLDERFEWLVLADGYRPQRGDERALRPRAVDHLVIEARLRPGWGVEIHTRDDRSDAPLEGVEIVADGARLALTDERGRAIIELDRAPLRLEAVKPGWTLADGANAVTFAPDHGGGVRAVAVDANGELELRLAPR